MTETIGFIGLGVLGSAMAGNLVKDGFPVVGRRGFATGEEEQAGSGAGDEQGGVELGHGSLQTLGRSRHGHADFIVALRPFARPP